MFLCLFHYLLDYERETQNFTSFFEMDKQKSGETNEFQTFHRYILEQDTGLEPAAYCLGSSRSTG